MTAAAGTKKETTRAAPSPKRRWGWCDAGLSQCAPWSAQAVQRERPGGRKRRQRHSPPTAKETTCHREASTKEQERAAVPLLKGGSRWRQRRPRQGGHHATRKTLDTVQEGRPPPCDDAEDHADSGDDVGERENGSKIGGSDHGSRPTARLLPGQQRQSRRGSSPVRVVLWPPPRTSPTPASLQAPATLVRS